MMSGGRGNGFHCGEMGVRGYVGSRLRGNDELGGAGMMSGGVGMGFTVERWE